MSELKPEELDDLSILQAIARGDNNHFELLVDRYKRRLFAFAFAKLRHCQDAEDVTQEVFIKVFRAARSGRWNESNRNLAMWIFAIAGHQVIDMRRKQGRRLAKLAPMKAEAREGVLTQLADGRPGPVGNASGVEERDRMLNLLAQLPAEQEEVVRLKVFGQLKFREIAVIQGCTEPTVKSRMRYALQHLQEGLAVKGFRSTREVVTTNMA